MHHCYNCILWATCHQNINPRITNSKIKWFIYQPNNPKKERKTQNHFTKIPRTITGYHLLYKLQTLAYYARSPNKRAIMEYYKTLTSQILSMHR